MNERQQHYLDIGRNDLAYDSLNFGGIRGGSAPDADMDTSKGSDLLLDQKNTTEKEKYSDIPKDFSALQEVILEASLEGTADSLARGEVAATLQVMMSEFLDDGESFLIKDDGQLNQWVRETVARLHPNVSEFDIDSMVRSLDGFPPTKHVTGDYKLAS